MTWDEFWKHHDKQHYTPVFNTFLDSQIADPHLPLLVRGLAWIVRNSWGRHSNDVVDQDGIRQSQVDCARELKVFRKNKTGELEPDRRRINPIFLTLERLRMIRFEGRDIFPIADPLVSPSLPPNDDPLRALRKEKAKITVDQFIEQVWRIANPKAYAEYQTVEHRYKELRTSVLSDFKAYSEMSEKSERGPTNAESRPEGDGQDVGEGPTKRDDSSDRGPTAADPSLYRTKNRYKGESSSSFSSGIEEEPAQKTTTTNPIEAALQSYGEPDHEAVAQIVKACQQRAPNCSWQEIVHFIHVKGALTKEVRNPIGLLLTAVPKCFFSNYRERLPDRLLDQPVLQRKNGLDRQAAATAEFMRRHLEELEDAG